MKRAPNLKHQPADKMTEVIIFAGSDAWAHAKQWQEMDGRLVGDNVPPVWLGEQQLAELDNLQIVPDGRYFVRIYKSGLLRPYLVNVIGKKLAAAGVQDADYYPEGMHSQKRENWRDYLARERQNLSDGLVIELPVKEKATGSHSDDELKPRVESREDGIYWVSPRADSQSGEIINNESWLCSPLSVIGTGRDDKDQYLILRWLSFGSETPTTAAIPLADIGEREGWRTLKAGGVNVTTKSSLRAILADWLQRSGSRELWRVAHATGWQCGAYIMPDGEIIGTPENPVLFSGRSSAAAGYTVSGSAKSWRDNVARLAFGNYSMMTGIGAALAAPLIGLVGADGFGIHFYEQSSAGKTTTANVASSLYGNPDLLRLTWY